MTKRMHLEWGLVSQTDCKTAAAEFFSIFSVLLQCYPSLVSGLVWVSVQSKTLRQDPDKMPPRQTKNPGLDSRTDLQYHTGLVSYSHVSSNDIYCTCTTISFCASVSDRSVIALIPLPSVLPAEKRWGPNRRRWEEKQQRDGAAADKLRDQMVAFTTCRYTARLAINLKCAANTWPRALREC